MSDREAHSGWCADPTPGDGDQTDLDLGSEQGAEHGPDLDPEFERVYRAHYPFVWRCARRMGVASDDLDDVLQDTFVAAYRRFDSWDRESRATTWLFGILRNVVRNRARGRRRHQRKLDALTQHEIAVPDRFQEGERLLAGELLRDFLAALDEDKRAVFVLAELEGLSGVEIGRALEISPNTASSRLRLARQAFAAHFDHAPTRRQVERATTRAREQPEQPPADAATRTLASIMAGPLSLAGAGASTGTVVGLGKLGLAKLAMVASVAGLAMVVIVASPRLPDEVEASAAREASPSAQPSPRARSRSTSARESADAIDEPDELDEAITILAESIPSAASPSPRGAAKAPSDLAGYEAIRAAREQLLANQPAAALELLASVADSSDPGLREARAATRIAALCQLDRGDEAKAIWSTLELANPASALVERLRAACWSND